MHIRTVFPVVAIIISLGSESSQKDQHSICYNYFLEKDACVYGSTIVPCSNGTSQPKTSGPTSTVAQVTSPGAVANGTGLTNPATVANGTGLANPATPSVNRRSLNHRSLIRRYDTNEQSSFVGGGNGTCGMYNTSTDLGVCLWDGPKGMTNNSEGAGWLNRAFTDNCQKVIYIQRKGQPATVQYVPVLDSCGFNTDLPEIGCFQVYVTQALYNLFQPTEAELSQGSLFNITWDFAKEVKADSYLGPV